MTKDCPREDCSIQSGISTMTCMGWTPTYDKSGNRTDRGDPNIEATAYRCAKCGDEWTVRTQYGVSVVSRRKIAVERRE
jgi:hypothetical protein